MLGVAALASLFVVGQHPFPITVGSMALGFGLLFAFMGVVMFFQGRRVDRLLDGEHLIASWAWPASDERKAGHVHIGPTGVLHDGVYLEWSRTYQLVGITLTEDLLVFTYDIVRSSAQTVHPRVRKYLRLPVPLDAREQAERVVATLDPPGT